MITGFLPHEAKIKLILMVYNFLLGEEEKLVMVPYDSEADQWPGLRKGHKAHWGVVFGMALMMPYKNKAFDQAKVLDGYTSYLKPPLSQETIDTILEDFKEIKFLLMVRQSKSKRIFLFNARKLAESNNNLIGYSNDHKHHELFMHDGFVMPPGGLKYGLKGQLVFLNKKNNGATDEINDYNNEDTSTDEESFETQTSDDGDKSM